MDISALRTTKLSTEIPTRTWVKNNFLPLSGDIPYSNISNDVSLRESFEEIWTYQFTEEQKEALVESSPTAQFDDFAISINESTGEGYIGQESYFGAMKDDAGNWIFIDSISVLTGPPINWIPMQTVIQRSATYKNLLSVGNASIEITPLSTTYGLSSSLSGHVTSSQVEAQITSAAGTIRQVLPISAMTDAAVQLTKDTYVYRVTDLEGTGNFPELSAPTDVSLTGSWYYTFELEWTTTAATMINSQESIQEWINAPEMMTDGNSHTYYIAGRYDNDSSVVSCYTLNCWRTK